MKRLFGLSALLLVVALLGGCGSSEQGETTQVGSMEEVCGNYIGKPHQVCVETYVAAREAEGVTVDEPPETETSPPPPMPYVATLRLSSEEGYKASVELRRGKLEHAEAGDENGWLYLGSACEVDYERDAAMPFHLKVTNTTPRYSASPGVNIIARTPHLESPGVLAEIGYSDGPQCVEFNGDGYASEEGGYLGFSPTNPLGPEEFTAAPGYFVIRNYFSPAKPQGNPAKIRQALLELAPAITDEHFGVSSASGVLSSQFVGDAIPVLPGGNGGCLIHPPCPAAFRTG